MKEKNTIKEIIIENDTEFYGFLTGSDIMTAAEVVRYLRIKAKCHIHNGDLERDVVEEIVRRGGTFYTGTEAKPIVPWDMIYTDYAPQAASGSMEKQSRKIRLMPNATGWLLTLRSICTECICNRRSKKVSLRSRSL